MHEKINYFGIIEGHIRELVAEFKNNPYNFFSESDVKCRLFMMLCRDGAISELKRTIDGKMISPLHSEVSYFNDKGKLLFHVDLSVIEPETTDVYSTPATDGIRFSKGYRAGECYVAIEIKLNKIFDKEKMLVAWEKDMRKLGNIRTRNPFLTCFSILLDKKNHILAETELTDFEGRYPQVRIVYANAGRRDFFINF
jgi:hypothetical protein